MHRNTSYERVVSISLCMIGGIVIAPFRYSAIKRSSTTELLYNSIVPIMHELSTLSGNNFTTVRHHPP